MKGSEGMARLSCAVLLCLVVHGASTSERKDFLQVTSGVCGRIFLEDVIGNDYWSAMAAVEPRVAWMCSGRLGCRIEPFEIEVDGAEGVAFHALKIFDRESGHMDFAVHYVVSSDGKLFTIQWCPD